MDRSLSFPESQRRHQRGSALTLVLIFSLAMAGILFVALSDTFSSRRAGTREDVYARNISAAEYGAEVAIAELSGSLRVQEIIDNTGDNAINDNAVVLSDWLSGTDGGGSTLFRVDNVTATDQRRITGKVGEQEFRVRVRSARMAYENDNVDTATTSGRPLKVGWLENPGSFEFGKDRLYNFNDIYEITSTAMHSGAVDGSASADLASRAVVRAIVRYGYESPLAPWGDSGSAVYIEDPRNFMLTATTNKEPVYDELGLPVINSYGDQATAQVSNILISGEDHSLDKYYVKEQILDAIIVPLKLTTNKANFFGADGSYWRGGHLTLNYLLNHEDEDPAYWDKQNPYRPYTVTVGASSSSTGNQAMRAWDPSRSPDTYLLGGKSISNNAGRTVTLVEDPSFPTGYRIKETSTSQVSEGASFNIVLGAFEDLRNLYINMTTGYGADLNKPTTWYQMFIGQYTEAARASNVKATSLPLYAGTKIRAQTLHTIINGEDQKLVREFEKPRSGGAASTAYYSTSTTDYFLYPISGSAWKGNYAWASCTFSSAGTFVLDSKEKGGGNVCVPRVFFWQELVGYSLVKRGAGGLTGEPALISSTDKRTYYRTVGGERVKVGFDEVYQTNPQVTGHRSNPGYLVDTFPDDASYVDIIYARQRKADSKRGLSVGDLKPHRVMDDFLFEKDFAENPGVDEPLLRDTLGIFIGYEDQQETGADYDYTDMMFTIYIAPGNQEAIIPSRLMEKVTEQWWEREEYEGLTGKDAHTPVSVISSTGSFGKSYLTLLQENFDLLNHTPKEDMVKRIFSMNMYDDAAFAGFPRAFFTKTEDLLTNTGELNLTHPLMAENIEAGVNTFHYTPDDVTLHILSEPDLYLYDSDGESIPTATAFANGEAAIKAKNNAFILKNIEERWQESVNLQATFQAEKLPSSFHVGVDGMTIRELAGEIIGTSKQNLPAIRTKDWARIDSDEEPRPEFLTFLAGELLQGTPPANSGNDGIIDGGIIPYRGAMVIPWERVNDAPRVANVLQYLADSNATTDAAVELCYRNYYENDPDLEQEIKAIYGWKENRYSIGFHRSGIAMPLSEYLTQDHYEYVSLGVRGFNPYRETARDPGNPNQRYYVALERVEPENPDDDPTYEWQYKYGDDALTPSFVFRKPIDGAGAMVVNGNLVVEDTFAYHGTLVVLGDVIVRPTLKSEYVMGLHGGPIDKYGHPLYQEDPYNPNSRWYYRASNNSNGAIEAVFVEHDENGQIVRDPSNREMPVLPMTQDVVKGELVVQGTLAARGRLMTDIFTHPDTGEKYTGKYTLLRSVGAIEDTGSVWAEGKKVVERSSWLHDDGIDVDSIWRNVHDE